MVAFFLVAGDAHQVRPERRFLGNVSAVSLSPPPRPRTEKDAWDSGVGQRTGRGTRGSATLDTVHAGKEVAGLRMWIKCLRNC